MNIELKDGFSQVCIWQGCVVVDNEKEKDKKINEFETFMLDNFKSRVQYLEEIKTGPDLDEQGNVITGTGGRNDLFFAVHSEDIGIFAVPRLSVGIRWIEDALAMANYKYPLYPKRIFKYIRWNHEAIKFPKSEGENGK